MLTVYAILWSIFANVSGHRGHSCQTVSRYRMTESIIRVPAPSSLRISSFAPLRTAPIYRARAVTSL